jgi:glycosyltransferase involved in cell wall biosynthesis
MKTGSRITVVHLITKLELGGAQLNTIYTVEHLDECRFQAVLASGPGGRLESGLAARTRVILVPALIREISPFRDLRALISLWRLFRRLQPQIVHTHSSKAGVLGRLAAGMARVPVAIHSVHGFSFAPAQSFFKRYFYLILEKLCRPLTDHFIFVADSDMQTARAHRLVGRGYSLIRSGFPLQKFRERTSDSGATKKKYQLEEDSFVCGIIAPFKPQKGLLHLLDIADLVVRENPRVIFFLAGDGEQRPQLEAEIERRGMARNFRLPGFIDNIESVMDCFDVGVSTALWEGLPQSLVQLRLKKIAVVASDIPGHREVIRDGCNGCLVPVDNHPLFANVILQLAQNRELRERWALFADEDFSEWDGARMVRLQEDLYQRLWSEHIEKKGDRSYNGPV